MYNEVSNTSSTNKVKDIVITGLLIALVFVATNIRLPVTVNGGLIHLGNVVLIPAAIAFGRKKGAISGAIGMGLFDVLSGWLPWAPFTFVIRAVMGYIIGSIANINGKKGSSILLNLIAVIMGGIWMLAGYYITEAILYSNWISPAASIPGNITQLVIGAVVGLPLAAILKRFKIAA